MLPRHDSGGVLSSPGGLSAASMTLLAPPGTPTKPAAAKKPRGASTMLRFSRYIYASVTACLIFLATRRFNPLCVDPAKFPRKGITTWVSPRDRHLPHSGRSSVWLHAKLASCLWCRSVGSCVDLPADLSDRAVAIPKVLHHIYIGDR